MAVIDISNPASPQLISTAAIGGDAFQVQLAGSLAYVAAGVGKVKVLDLGNPAQPAVVLNGIAGSSVHGLQVSGNYAYLADRLTGLVVSRLIGLPAQPPRVLELPATVTAAFNQDLIISARVDGTPPLAYQWYLNEVPLVSTGQVSVATGPNLRLQGLNLGNAGSYRLQVSSPYGSVSSNVFLTVSTGGAPLLAPSFQTPSRPTRPSAREGMARSFNATLLGSAPLDCRWYHNGAPLGDDARISGSATADLRISNVQFQDGGGYQLKVWNGAGLAATPPVTLTFVGAVQAQLNAAVPGPGHHLAGGGLQRDAGAGQGCHPDGNGRIRHGAGSAGAGHRRSHPAGRQCHAQRADLRQWQRNQRPGSGRFKNEGHLILTNCLVAGSAAGRWRWPGQPAVRPDHLQHPEQQRRRPAVGGGVYNGPGATLNLDNSTVTGNTAADGGGLYAAGNYFATNCAMWGNLAARELLAPAAVTAAGSAVPTATAQLVNCTVSGNQAQNPSGGRRPGRRPAGGRRARWNGAALHHRLQHGRPSGRRGFMPGSGGVVSVHSSIVADNQAAGALPMISRAR